MEENRLSGRQSTFLLCLFMFGNLVTAGGAKGVHSGWLLFLLLLPPTLLILLLFAQTSSYDPEKGNLNILRKLMGLFFITVYSILAIFYAGDSIRLFADFIVINDLNDAGALGNTGLMTVIVLLLLYSDKRGLGKLGWSLLPLCMLLLFASIFATMGKLELQRLLPLFDTGRDAIARAMIGTVAGVVAPVFFPIMSFRGEIGKRSALAAGIAVFVTMALLTARDGAVLGYPVAELFRFPSYQAAGVLRHSELLISAVFVLTQPFRTALCLRYVQSWLVCWKPRFQRWYPPMLLGLAVITGVLSWSGEQVRWRTQSELAVTALLLMGPLLVLLLKKVRTKT